MESKENKNVSLNKIVVLPKSEEIEIASREDESYQFYEYRKESIGMFSEKAEAESALEAYQETGVNVLGYEIVGPEHGHGSSEFVLNEEDGLYDEIWETEEYDESPEFHMVYDADRQLVSSYCYGSAPSQDNGAHQFQKGDKAWVLTSMYMGDCEYQVMVPVEIAGLVPLDYFEKKQNIIDLELDSLTFKPFITLKCNWGECPSRPIDDLPRVDIFPYKEIEI